MEMVIIVSCLISQGLTKNDCQELNKTDKASQSMTNQKNQNDRNKQQSNGDLSSSVISFGILCLLQPLGPLPDLHVDGPVEGHQDYHGHEVLE